VYSSKIRSGNAEVIDSNTVLAFVPSPFEKKKSGYSQIEEPKPIQIDLFYSGDLLFRLYFDFQNDEKYENPSWESSPDLSTKTQKFIIKNINRANGRPVGSNHAFEFADGADGSKFLVSFTAVEVPFGVQFTYTVYRVSRGNF
jgi:hypothetical protein